jgi:hypothetical protein
MRRLSENEKKHRDMPDYVSGEINGLGGSDKLKTSLYHFVKILKDKNDRKDAQRKLNKNIRSIVDVLEDVYNIVENTSYDQKLESLTEIPLGQSLSPKSENVDYDVTTFTGSHAETLKKVLLRFYSKYLYIGPQIKHGDQVQQFEYNKRHILKDLDIFINMQLMKLDDDIQNENKKTMKKVIRLTESDLTRIVKRVINENKEDMIRIPSMYKGVRMELGKRANPQDIIEMYNELVEEGSTLVDYSEYGTEGMFYNEEGDEIPTDVILDELNYAIVGEEDEDYDDEEF